MMKQFTLFFVILTTSIIALEAGIVAKISCPLNIYLQNSIHIKHKGEQVQSVCSVKIIGETVYLEFLNLYALVLWMSIKKTSFFPRILGTFIPPALPLA